MTLSKVLIAYVKNTIDRYAWSRWETRHETLVKARVKRGQYQCAGCLDLFGPKNVQVDHIKPRVDPKQGWQGFDEYITRTFTDELQVLCKDCHIRKSTEENSIRAVTRGEKK